MLGPMRHSHPLESIVHALLPFRGRHPAVGERELDVL
jgi:hypothetical protein